jgi:hypothetical protein
MNHSCADGILLSALLTASARHCWCCVLPLRQASPTAIFHNAVVGAANAHGYANTNNGGRD